ncbi:hypothetical protein MAPG_00798 [Magnaporthiopsis poae ATCC 64411]|uniref:C2H2-type domain-containing protein n=1 Tax=Magnaporthiopsis poae (strain ATCC 64411 / 73-15) TaxID=644358 RepID=A0A0C4DLZ6_MAGP6|nr:hypothetical protein MAPG_00798 [Magnaporthiopsis poae ATCC 64411]
MRSHMESSYGHFDMEDSYSYSSSPSGSFSSSVSSPYGAVTPNSTRDSFGCQTPPPRRHSSLNFEHRLGAADMRMVMTLPDHMHNMTLQPSAQGYYHRDNYPPVTPPRTGNPMDMSIPAPLSFMGHQMPPLHGTPGAYSYDGLPQSPPFLAHTPGYQTQGTPSPGAQASVWVHGGSPVPMFETSSCSRSSPMSMDMSFDRIGKREMPGGEHRHPSSSTGRTRPAAGTRRTPRQQSTRATSRKPADPTDDGSIPKYEKNKFQCSHVGCNKRYKRPEHKVRHEMSHSKEPRYFYCHPDCSRKHQTRDRFDNFYSHFKKHTDENNPNYIPGAALWWEQHYRDMDKRRKPRSMAIKREE